MKRIVRLTENDLARIVRRVINERHYLNEAPTADKLANMGIRGQFSISGVFGPNEVKVIKGGKIWNFDDYNIAKVYSGTITYTKEGAAFNGKLVLSDTFPFSCSPVSERDTMKGRDNSGQVKAYNASSPFQIKLTAPSTPARFAADTQIATVTYVTNDPTKVSQTVPIVVKAGSQFGVAGASRN
jgi:hypothetical protein